MKEPKISMCWRHKLSLFLAAFGTLLDITGREYPRRAKRVFAASRACEDCRWPTIVPAP